MFPFEYERSKLIDSWGLGLDARVNYMLVPETQKRLPKEFVIIVTLFSTEFKFLMRW